MGRRQLYQGSLAPADGLSLLQRGGKTQRGMLINASESFHRHHLRLAFGQGAGFIENRGVEFTGALQRIGIAHQHAVLRRPANAGDNRHRRRRA